MTKVTLIAECGCNWHSIENAKEMIRLTKMVDGDNTLCKFQLFNEDTIKGSPLYKQLKPLILTEDKAKELFDYGASIGQEVFFSVMYPEAVDICERIGVKRYKIRHKDYEDLELIGKCLKTKKNIYISQPTNRTRLKLSYKHSEESPWEMQSKFLKYLYCIPKYPTTLENYKNITNNFKSLLLRTCDGLSCHCPSITPSIMAISYGAKIIEKHVMMENTDWSLTGGRVWTPIEKDWSITFGDFKLLRQIVDEMGEMI